MFKTKLFWLVFQVGKKIKKESLKKKRQIYNKYIEIKEGRGRAWEGSDTHKKQLTFTEPLQGACLCTKHFTGLNW